MPIIQLVVTLVLQPREKILERPQGMWRRRCRLFPPQENEQGNKFDLQASGTTREGSCEGYL